MSANTNEKVFNALGILPISNQPKAQVLPPQPIEQQVKLLNSIEHLERLN